MAGGYRQRKGIDFKETYAPVAKFVSLRILLTILAVHDWECEQGDIVTAFLHGELDDQIYMRPPDGIYPRLGEEFIETNGHSAPIDKHVSSSVLVWKLKKSLYGLRQSPRCFYTKLDNVLKEQGYLRVQADYGVWIREGKVTLIVHVDDMLLLGSVHGLLALKNILNNVFVMKWVAVHDTIFLGLRIRRLRAQRILMVSQEKYAIEIAQRFGLADANECATPMEPKTDWSLRHDDVLLDPSQTKQYQAAIGSLIYLMLGSRPDLAYAINKLAQYSSKPTQRHWKGVKRIIRFVKRTAYTALVLGHRDTCGERTITGYFDAAYMDDTTDRHSTMGYIFFYLGCPISWSSKKQHTIALSTTEAEYLAGTEATKESMWIAAFLKGINAPAPPPTRLLGDNQGANALAYNPEYHARTKHIHARQRFLTEMVEKKEIEVVYIPTCDMVADILTKALPRDSYECFMKLMGLHKFRSTNYECDCGNVFRSKSDLVRHYRNSGHGTSSS